MLKRCAQRLRRADWHTFCARSEKFCLAFGWGIALKSCPAAEMKIFNPPASATPPHSVQVVPAPVGALCDWCEEPFAATDPGVMVPYFDGGNASDLPYHSECFMRSIVGSVAHQLKECGCYGGNRDDPPGLSKREAAKMALDLFSGKV